MSEQLYELGDVVRLEDGSQAVVLSSYADQYGCGDVRNYHLDVPPGKKSSWYNESELVKTGRLSDSGIVAMLLDNHRKRRAR